MLLSFYRHVFAAGVAPVEWTDVLDLVLAIQTPLAVFRSATLLDSKVIMTELQHVGKNHFDKQNEKKQSSLGLCHGEKWCAKANHFDKPNAEAMSCIDYAEAN